MPVSARSASYVIISGGTGANAIASAFGSNPAFVLPVSDDGGSSSEILRCFGGPSIGDIRSRLTRLIPLAEQPVTKDERERQAIHELMAYRFPADASEKAVREIWGEIVEGRSSLWEGIGDDKKECIRAFLVHFNALTLKRAHKRFSFRNFSLGNGFLTGARDMFGSLPSAIFLFKSAASVPPGAAVIPVINTNQTVTIAAELENGESIVGQCAISHPAQPAAEGTATAPLMLGGIRAGVPVGRSGSVRKSHFRRDSRTFDTFPSEPSKSATSSQQHSPIMESSATAADLSGPNISYRKGEAEVPLDSPVRRILYINLYGQEIFPSPNPDYLDAINDREILVYSCGSLWTSIVPCLVLQGLGRAISQSRALKAKVVLLNTKNDRETTDYTATDYVDAVIASLTYHDRRRQSAAFSEDIGDARPYITHLVYLEGCSIDINLGQLAKMKIDVVKIPATVHGFQSSLPLFTPESVSWAMSQILS